jgi:hypothetical protein
MAIVYSVSEEIITSTMCASVLSTAPFMDVEVALDLVYNLGEALSVGFVGKLVSVIKRPPILFLFAILFL